MSRQLFITLFFFLYVTGLIINTPIRVHGTTADVLKDILRLIPLDQYCANPVEVMDRVDSDKAKNLFVPAYNLIAEASGIATDGLLYVERFQFYERAKKAFLVIQTDDRTLYANCIISKGVV